MFELDAAYILLKSALDENDILYLKNACKSNLETEHIPCFSLINKLNSKTVRKIKLALEKEIGEELFYLNDFYIYTDNSFKTAWHMDTELFSFSRAVNAWILLSPEKVADPLGFIDGVNNSDDNYYHSTTVRNGVYTFSQYRTKQKMTKSTNEIEASHIHTPIISRGDILAIDPSRFHKTNVNSPKHAIGIKFILKGPEGYLSNKQVHPILWPEVRTFNNLVKGTSSWNEVIEGIRQALKTDEGRKNLSSGFYPAQFEMYVERARSM